MAKDMEQAYARGDTTAVLNAICKVNGNTKSFSSKTPSKNKDGELIMGQESLAEMWRDFLEGKFKATDEESRRPDYQNIGEQTEDDPLTKEAFLRALARLKTGKACGPDDIPGEVFKNSDAAGNALFTLLCRMWELEYVPPALVRVAFVMLYKKACVDDPSNYRCIGLLPHSYKILSSHHNAG